MIFCAKNEDGIPTWKLVLEGKKTVTRRLKPLPVGKEFAIQPGRGKKAVARGRVLSCWISHEYDFYQGDYRTSLRYLEEEAQKEGFKTWKGLTAWFVKHYININDTYRIEFELIKKE